MATLNELIRARKSVLKQLRQALKPVDTQLELIERTLKRLQARKNKVPESVDLLQVTQMASTLDRALSTFSGRVKDAIRVFGTV